MTNLQLALDGEMASTLFILEKAHPYIDIAEIGTPLVFREGMRAIRQVRAAYPQLCILADLKIMDAGATEAEIAFNAGADRVTVMAVASDATIRGAVQSARQYGKQVMIDMMQVSNPLERARQLLQLGCNLLCVHTAHDLQSTGASPWKQLAYLRQALPTAQLAIAGGVKLEALDTILPLKPQVIIVGSAITGAADPVLAAQQIHDRISAHGIRSTD